MSQWDVSLLTHLNQWNSPLLSIGLAHFSFKGWLVVFFIFIQILIQYFVSKHCGDTDKMPRSDLGLHCLPMSNKKDARLIEHKFW